MTQLNIKDVNAYYTFITAEPSQLKTLKLKVKDFNRVPVLRQELFLLTLQVGLRNLRIFILDFMNRQA